MFYINDPNIIDPISDDERDFFFKCLYVPKVPVTLEEKFEDCRRILFENIDRQSMFYSDRLELKYFSDLHHPWCFLFKKRRSGATHGLYKYFTPVGADQFDKYGQPLNNQNEIIKKRK